MHVRKLAEPVKTGLLVARFEGIVAGPDEPAAETYTGLVGSAPDAALLLWGAEGVCLAHNHRLRALTGLRPASIGQPIVAHAPELEACLAPKLEAALGGVATAWDDPPFAGRGTDAEVVGWVLPVFGSGGLPAGALLLFMRAGGAAARMSRLVGMAAHDLRDPVIGVRMLAQRLARNARASRERLEEELGRVVELAEHMERIIDDLGAFSRLTNGIRFAPRPCDLATLVRGACDALGAGQSAPDSADGDGPLTVRGDAIAARLPPPPPDHDGAAGGPSVHAGSRASPSPNAGSQASPGTRPRSGPDGAGVGPLTVATQEVFGLWDADAVRRIVVNLVTNARKHGPEGAPVHVSLALTKDGAVLDVTDQGPGIAEHEIDQLFEPWRRGPGSESGQRPGAGLGLHIVRELVTAQGGRITCERALPLGFTMRVTLPVPGSGVFRAPER